MGKETPLILFPSEGFHPAWQNDHSGYCMAEASTNHRTQPLLPQAPWFWFSMQMSCWVVGRCLVSLKAV